MCTGVFCSQIFSRSLGKERPRMCLLALNKTFSLRKTFARTYAFGEYDGKQHIKAGNSFITALRLIQSKKLLTNLLC